MSGEPLVVNGWEIYAHPLFLDQLDALIAAVERARIMDPDGYSRKRSAKLLAAILKIAFEVIPEDPSRPVFRQGGTLGPERKHWFRAKFLQQYRLFFRYQDSAARKVIVLAWVNDQTTLRAYASNSDAYAVFRDMLGQGNPPDDWDALMRVASDRGARTRLGRSRAGAARGSEADEPA